MPSREEAVLPYIIEGFAVRTPDRPCVTESGRGQWTWAVAAQEMHRAASSLCALGVERGEFVGLMLPNGLDWLRAWWGLARLGARTVMINPAYRGEILRHVCEESRIGRIITSSELGERLVDVGLTLEVVTPEMLVGGSAEAPDLAEPLQLWDLAGVIFTSGTTGPSKGALVTHMQLYTASPKEWCPRPDDVFFVQGPLFHMSGLTASVSAWRSGASVALHPKFQGSTFFSDVRDSGATVALVIGTMASVLAASPQRPDDAENPLRAMIMIPVIPNVNAFMERFGIEKIFVMYGMSELPRVFGWEWTKVEKPQSVGRLIPGFEVRLVDDDDLEVGKGAVGELIVRSDGPWTIATGYLNRPQETIDAWRNGWFHTRDVFSKDEEGFYYFVDRATDSLRRRGENISSFEVEREVLAFPGVAEAACVAAPGRHGDDEVKVVIVPAEDSVVDPAELIEFLGPRLPHFMLPRYVQIVEELPKTPSTKVKKFELRKLELKDAWDREAVR